MAAKSYTLTFDGYWREPNIDALPAKSGIYCVYTCTFNEQKKKVSLERLIYIGEADDVRGRVQNHEKSPAWRKKLKPDEQICFSCAPIAGEDDRHRAEAAEIFEHKPPCNTEYADSFPFDRTTISNDGETALVTKQFTVERT